MRSFTSLIRFKFRENMDTLKNFAKSVVAHIFAKKFIYSESADHVL